MVESNYWSKRYSSEKTQLIDMEENTARWQHFRQLLRKNMDAARGGRRNEVDVLRTAIWFAEIKMRLKASTAYEIERLLEPKAFGKNKDGDHIHRNKWPKYKAGQHVPNDALVRQVEVKLPGTKRLLNHVLWRALQTKSNVNENIDDWLRQLAPDIQQIVFCEDRHNPGSGSRKTSLSRRQLKMLERRASIDALTCLTILIRESSNQGAQANVLDLGTSLYRVLLILCTTAPIGNFALELLDIYRERIFSLVRYEGLRFYLEDIDFLDAVDLLHTLLLALEDGDLIGVGWDESVQAISKLFEGGYGQGFNVKFALDPLIGPAGPLTDVNDKDYRDLERQKRFRQWGKEQIFSAERKIFPPPELW